MTTIDRRRRSRRTRDEAREDYLAALSHELRTPLGGVLGLAELLSGTRLDAEQQAYVSSMRDCGRHLLALVSDVLDLAKIDAGKLELLPAPVDVEDLLRGVAELLSPRAHEKGLEIAWAADGLDGQVIADAGRLRQILYNLVGNAVKFTGTGGVLITARAKPSASNGWRIRFSVADTGPGIPAKDRKHIFEPFGQADGSAERRDSTGLGLTVVERLVRAMEGELGLDSAPGKGATFWFEIHAPAAAASGRTSVPSLAGLTVDVVSPCATTRQAAEMQIEASGGRARLFDTMAEARSARPGGPALIDAACEGAAALPGRPCLILIKPEERPTIANSRRVGFAGYLIKPLRRASIAARALAVMGATALTAPGDDERGATRSVRGLRVLLAEDDPVNALLARTLLAREGCEIACARTGPEAMEAASSQTFDLILMDRRLPGLDGLEATRRLRAAGIATPVVALTADAYEEDRRECLASGMDAFVAKPLDGDTLRSLLARVAGGAFTDAPGNAKLAS